MSGVLLPQTVVPEVQDATLPLLMGAVSQGEEVVRSFDVAMDQFNTQVDDLARSCRAAAYAMRRLSILMGTCWRERRRGATAMRTLLLSGSDGAHRMARRLIR